MFRRLRSRYALPDVGNNPRLRTGYIRFGCKKGTPRGPKWLRNLGYVPTQLYDSLTFTPRKSRKSWIAQIIRSTCAYHQIWNNRNSIVHSSDEPTIDIFRVRMQESVLSWYERLDELTSVGRNLLPAAAQN
jgi:hypothetical protein